MRDEVLQVRGSRYEPLRVLVSGEPELVLARAHSHSVSFERLVVLKRARTDSIAVRAALVREAAAHARVSHPAIVGLHDVLANEHDVVLVMEHVDGATLEEVLIALHAAGRRLPDPAALFVGARVMAALTAAHAARHPLSGEFSPVIHRNVSPASVRISWDGFAKLTDFGLARLGGEVDDPNIGGSFYSGYMAPEQIAGDAVTVRTDVFAACALLRDLLAGRIHHRPDLPPAIARAIQTGLEADPDARAISAAQIVEVLRTHADLALGQRQLLEVMERIRRERASIEPPLDTMRPVAPSDAPSRPSSRAVAPFAAAVLVLLAAVISVAAFRTKVRPTRAAAASPVVAAAPAEQLSPAPIAVVGPTPVAATLSLPTPSSGTLTVDAPPMTRVWVDGQMVGEGPRTLELPCGPHTLQVGSRGQPREVNVPCGAGITTSTAQ